MKKTIISLLLLAVPVVMSAQLKVFSTGNVSLKTTANNPYAYLMVSPSTYTGYSSYSIGTLSSTYVTKAFSAGVMATAFSDSPLSSYRSFGVIGKAGNATSGYNYGLFGMLPGSNNGGAVVGVLSDQMGIYINGRYAGYFNGDTKVNGTLYATSVQNTSDIRLKENIVSLIDKEDGNTTLDKIRRMNVIEYNFKSQTEIPQAERDTISPEMIRKDDELSKDRHYGLSAQELQTLYPYLVKEGQDGYLTVNYIELVPILIRSIQELKQELDEVKGVSGNAKMTRGTTTAVSGASASYNVLYQNTPNPFKEQTTIRFSLAKDAHDAAICIFDMTGKMLKKLPISSGETSVSINGWELGEGMFLYTLMVNGREIDTKRMIITK